jgi:hypothetical protein
MAKVRATGVTNEEQLKNIRANLAVLDDKGIDAFVIAFTSAASVHEENNEGMKTEAGLNEGDIPALALEVETAATEVTNIGDLWAQADAIKRVQ